MRLSNIFLAAAATTVTAQRPSDTPICDYYTKALLKQNTAKNQHTLLTLLVNTVVIGNYTMPNVGVKVPGILAPGNVDGKDVNLLPYFDGELASSNRHGKATAVNNLDGGGADPLKKNMPANDTSSNQYFLLTHLYEFFGALLGCSMQGMSGFDAYDGEASMYEVHKFMDLDSSEVTYFIEQVGLAAASFGVAKDDITVVANALVGTFAMKCSPAATVVKAQGPQLQAICIADDCPQAKAADCSKYGKATEPSTVSSGMSMPTGNSTSSMAMPTGGMTTSAPGGSAPSGTASPPSSTVPANGAAALSFSAALLVGAAALML